MKRPILIATGYVSLGLGIAGIFLPLVPTTPLVLVAAWCFARSSPRLHAALLANKRLGPPLRVWQEERAISRRGKVAALGSLGASLGILTVAVEPALVALASVPMGAVAAYVATRPRPRSEAAPAARATDEAKDDGKGGASPLPLPVTQAEAEGAATTLRDPARERA
jgi:hypothetical protein